MIFIANIETQDFIDGNMDEFTTDVSNEPAKQSPRIKLIIFCCTSKGIYLDSRISTVVASSFKFCPCLPQHSWDSVSDKVQVLSSLVKVLHFPGSLMKSPSSASPRTPERQLLLLESRLTVMST